MIYFGDRLWSVDLQSWSSRSSDIGLVEGKGRCMFQTGGHS
jgi:hypothetical protein